MNEDEYLSARVDDQIEWYDTQSSRAQSLFKLLRGLEIVAAASIPVLAGLSVKQGDGAFSISLVIGLLGAAIAVISSFISLYQLQERWIQYRSTCELLRHDKFLFMTKSKPYDRDDAFTKFVNRIEGIVSKENSSWSQDTASNQPKLGDS